MILSYKIHNVAPYINWIYFFHAWGFQPRFAAIANIHGCDVCRASWLTTFPEEDRNKASEAMQLFKEANRMLEQLTTQMAQEQGVTEELKAQNQMLWVQRMNNIRQRAEEIVMADLIYS